MWRIMMMAVLIALGALAAPSVSWKSFEVATPPMCGALSWCATVAASDAIKDSGLSMTPTILDNYTILGSNSDTVVFVKCTLNLRGHMSVTLVSTSTHPLTAKLWKDQIALKMLSASC